MNKCNWFGHKWNKWVLIPPTRFKNLVSCVRLQQRTCERCGKNEIEEII